MVNTSGLERMLTGLLEASHLVTLDDIPAVVNRHAAQAGLGEVVIYLADLQQRFLRPLTADSAARFCLAAKARPPDLDATDELLRVDGTLAGRAFQEVRPLRQQDEDGRHLWWLPLLDGTDRLGLLRLPGLSAEPPPAGQHLASLVALLLVSHRTHSDTYARLMRSKPMTIPAEMQWRLISPLTCATPRVTVAAAMEPAYEIGGDTFDYAFCGDTLSLSVFDAMGHDLSAGQAANLAMAACRNHRRQGMGLDANSEAIERVLIEEFGRANLFVTAVMAELDLRTGKLAWVNRGHPLPVLIRGGRWSTTLECPPAHPMGMDIGLPVKVCREQLEPGDRLLLYTDGITEAGAAQGNEFGLSRFVDFIIRHHSDELPVPETLRRLILGVLTYHDGRLGDDATVLLAEWRGAAHEPLRPTG
ncbi:PP2C family protein-serine/threonine phosphatase [Spongiactinospora sp. TRM90649]|uniref:PP2C family protein-serine/threonine phosphatase n=1 Tax=Spongiactinospora sp. TRM90649 TaxID=3031114 RepID=UPI0023F72547|nr:PP2C family protein-serine/threonine phosphatase [Spongiactinospora sp. TRM90649]MDF5755156.1 PP2C family protein-serine/threonine phosphatase [Spongiactinospora sp. TRM90649]